MSFFSVIIPLYNKADHIENTIKSVLSQNFTDYEIIIINDGSTDESEKIVLSFVDSRIKYFFKKNEGASVARNYGIEKSTGEFIAFLDADDLWFSNHLEELKKLIINFPNAGMYASRYQLIFKNNSTYTPDFKGIDTTYTGIVNDYFDASINYAIATSSSIAVPKFVFKDTGNFNPIISSGQDVDMWIRIALKYPIIIGNKITASYLHHIENSLSKTSILEKKINDFSLYNLAENKNHSLKKYLDLYRMEYALQYKIAGNTKKALFIFNQIDLKNIPLKSKILFRLPSFFLKFLKNIKLFLRNKGIEFSIYQ